MEFPENRLPGIYRLLRQYEHGREIHIFRSREEAEEYLAEAGALEKGILHDTKRTVRLLGRGV